MFKKGRCFFNDDGFFELQVAWMKELEENLGDNPYRFILLEHIELFKQEIGYSSRKLNESLVLFIEDEIKNIYREISIFKEKILYYINERKNRNMTTEGFKTRYMLYETEVIPSCRNESAEVLEIFIGDMNDSIKSSSRSIYVNYKDEYLTRLKNFFYEMFGYEMIDISTFRDDNEILIEHQSLAERYREYFSMIKSVLSDDNYLDIYKLTMFTYDNYAENFAYLESLRDGVEFLSQGVLYCGTSDDTRQQFKVFFDEIYGNMVERKKTYERMVRNEKR